MDRWTKTKEWVNEHAPLLAVVYQNKYVGMAYDRFASLPAAQQKQSILGGFGFTVALIVGYLLLSYYSLWSYSNRTEDASSMVTFLQQYQKQQKEKSSQLQQLQRNNQLAPAGEMKQHLLDLARSANISPRSIQAEEKPDGAAPEGDGKEAQAVRTKHTSVVLERVNLSQLKAFLNYVELGQFNLGVSTIKITNDDKIRGYMKAEMGIVAYLFPAEDSE